MLATAGNLVFLPDAAGTLHAYNAETGKELVVAQRRHRPCRRHHQLLGRRQAVHRRPAGFGGMVTDDFRKNFGEPYTSMPRNEGVLVVYSLK